MGTIFVNAISVARKLSDKLLVGLFLTLILSAVIGTGYAAELSNLHLMQQTTTVNSESVQAICAWRYACTPFGCFYQWVCF